MHETHLRIEKLEHVTEMVATRSGWVYETEHLNSFSILTTFNNFQLKLQEQVALIHQHANDSLISDVIALFYSKTLRIRIGDMHKGELCCPESQVSS